MHGLINPPSQEELRAMKYRSCKSRDRVSDGRDARAECVRVVAATLTNPRRR
jgi:hypothetical protein